MKFMIALCALFVSVNALTSTYLGDIIGPSGIVREDGRTIQFTREEADNILLVGPSGILTRDGQNIQLKRNPNRSKRSSGFVTPKGNIGYSGILRADGSTDLFSHDEAHNILLIGPSGIVSKDGKNMQFTDDLRIVGRSKRSAAGFVTPKGNIGYSGILRADGSTDLFSHDEAHNILLIGPSGIVTKDGKNMQLTDDLKIVNRRS
ncbi:cuticle protein CP1158-like [Macrobrachium nipponense]|uniref:cuticle protein CP1158-like n=1 Tax=Macrobrachium nipponense TaxID=159736 RepID=UPI0030C883D7